MDIGMSEIMILNLECIASNLILYFFLTLSIVIKPQAGNFLYLYHNISSILNMKDTGERRVVGGVGV